MNYETPVEIAIFQELMTNTQSLHQTLHLGPINDYKIPHEFRNRNGRLNGVLVVSLWFSYIRSNFYWSDPKYTPI